MKLLDKIKDLFMDEVTDDDEIEIEEEPEFPKETPKVTKEENALPKVMRETIKKEEKKEDLNIEAESFIKDFGGDMEVKKEEPKEVVPPKRFSFPVEFTEDELPKRKERTIEPELEPERSNINVLNLERETPKKVSELYVDKREEPKVKSRFKATPVISPVYGILDKNYTKEEVKERDEDSSILKRPSKKVDFEMVRKKAFGNLVDDIKDNMLCENCELYKEVKKISALKEDDLLYDMTVEDDDKELTISKAYENYREFGVTYEPKPARREEPKEVIKEEPKEEVARTPVVEEPVKEEPPVKEELPVEDRAEELTKLDDIINNNVSKIEEFLEEKEDETPAEEFETMYKEKIEEASTEEFEVPKRSAKRKEEKVDDDFFELIDSMYKERTDD